MQSRDCQEQAYEETKEVGNWGPSDTRIERLSQQIKDAKASLHHYVQTSPLRQKERAAMAAGGNYGQQQVQITNQRPMATTAMEYNQQASRHRNSADESSQLIVDRSRPSTDMRDLDQVSGGYTEFFSWGNDDKGQLGHGVDQGNPKRTLNLPKSLSFEVLIRSVACGAQHSGFVTHEGHVFTFGCNQDGQLGIDDRNLNQSTAPLLVSSLLHQGVTVRKIACGSYHTMVHTDSDQVYTWGRNQQGQCGYSPSSYNKFYGPHLLNFDASHPVSRIECGDLNSAIVTKAGQLYTFGDNSQGQLGLGNGVFRSQIAVEKPTRVQDIFDEVVQVSCGYRHTLVLTIKGSLYGFGSNRRHEMGLGESPQAVENNFYAPLKLEQLDIHNIVHTAAGGFSAAITDQNQMIVWGTGQFGVFSTPQKVCMDGIYFSDIQISKQETSFATAIDQKGAVYTWGPNFDGQLGQGDFNTRTLPSQIMRLKRKQIRAAALGDRFAIAIGKDVSLADLKRRKAAKARRQQEANAGANNAADRQQHSTTALRVTRGDNHVHSINLDEPRMSTSGQDPPSHRRLNSMQQRVPSAYQRDTATFHPTIQNSSAQNRSFENVHRDNRQHNMPLSSDQRQGTEPQQPLRTTQKSYQEYEQRQESVGRSESPIPSQTIYSGYQGTLNTHKENQREAKDQHLANGRQRGSHSPLRQNRNSSHPHENDQANEKQLLASPSANAMNFARTSTVSADGRNKSPYGPQADSSVKRHYSELERLFHNQLDEKEGVVRQQQTTIQELRVQLTADARSMQNRIDELNDKLRGIERERNDLRTRLANELRNYQLSKEELMSKNRALEEENQQERARHQNQENRQYEDNKNREMIMEERHRLEQQNTVSTLEEQHRNHCEAIESSHRQERDGLQAEIQNLRNLYEHECSKYNTAANDIDLLENEKRQLQETVASRGSEIRDLHQQNDRTSNHLKAVQIERDTIQERMQVTVAQMNQDIAELQKSIGLQNVRIEEGRQREEDLHRQLEHERVMVGNRDRRIDEQSTEITCLRKQIEDQNYKISEIDGARADLNQRFEDLRIESMTQQEKLKSTMQVCENQENMLQSTRLSLERERQRADQNQADLDTQNTINNALRRDLFEEQRRVKSRESDIQNLELSLNHLKDSMGQEFAAKSRDFENLKRAYDELNNQHSDITNTLSQRNDELDSAHGMNRELQAHANTLLDKVTYQESVIADLEEKNKRLTDLLNQHLNDRAANYKEKVLQKLTERDRSPHVSACATRVYDLNRSVSPFNDISNQRSLTPNRHSRKPSRGPPEDSSSRLAQILRREHGGQQDQARSHYAALQQQLQQEKFNKTPIRGHEIDLAAGRNQHTQLKREGTVSMTNIGGASISPMRSGPSDNMPPAIFSQSSIVDGQHLNYQSSQYQPQPRDSLNVSNASPLRSGKKSPHAPTTAVPSGHGSLRERESLATQVASLNHSALANRFNPHHTHGNNSQNYSPLRQRTPPPEILEAKEQDAMQLQNSTISANNISHRVMMNELRNLRSQIADVQRQKSELEGRLSNYEANQQH